MNSKNQLVVFLLPLACALFAGQAVAASEPVSVPTPAAAHPDSWQAGYAQARARMLAGQFPQAALGFEMLIASAPDLGSRMLVAEMASACRTWAQGGFVLASPGTMALAPPANLEDRRTTDEIAILYTNAVLFGLYAGIVVDVWAEPKSPSTGIPAPLFLAGAAAGAVALLDHNLRLGYGVAQSIVSGMYIGLEEGIAWSLWHDESSPSSRWGDKAVMTLILSSGAIGAVAGGIVGTLHGTTPGRASLMGSAAMWSGLVAGTLVGGLSDKADTALLASGIALSLGAAAGILAGAEVSPSIARVRFIDLGGICGGLLAGGVYWMVQDKNAGGRGLLVSSSLGMAAGLVTSWLLTHDMDTDQPRKRREPSFAEHLIPTVAPATSGTGFVLGVASI